jgi:hypothetical protein
MPRPAEPDPVHTGVGRDARLTETVVIAERFHGPPRSGNGGYVCGVAAAFVGDAAEVSLRAPPPLETPIDVVRDGDNVILRHDGADIAHARVGAPSVTPPPSPGLRTATDASRTFPPRGAHFFPGCFTCGPAHPQGLHIFSGPVREGFVASPWRPAPDLADEDGLVRAEFMWAALDCPTYWALPRAGEIRAVLARLTAQIDARPRADDTLVVAAWPLDTHGRKHRGAAAIYDQSGAILARAEALWIEVKPEQFT